MDPGQDAFYHASNRTTRPKWLVLRKLCELIVLRVVIIFNISDFTAVKKTASMRMGGLNPQPPPLWLRHWTNNNLMNISWDKTEEMLITTSRDMLCDAICVSNNTIERVYSNKLLGVTIDNLKWCSHVNSVCAKASSRLRCLKILKRCSLSTDDLLYFYNSAVRPVLEYACPRGTLA